MTKKNETVVKIAQTALMAALCFVSFQFCSLKLFFRGRRNVFSCRKCILRTGGSDLGRMVRRTYGSYRNGIRRYSRSGLYYRSAEDVCTEIMYRTYRRSCGS